MVSHRYERAYLSSRAAHKRACAVHDRREGMSALSRAEEEAQMRHAAGADKDFDWPRGGVPNRGIAVLEEER